MTSKQITLLLESEVAERLCCSTSTVKRLRNSGQLPYIPGRPVLIDEADLLALLEKRKRQTREETDPAAQQRAREEKASRRARLVWMQHNHSRSRG
ncbi:helix-turn-helix transcriptional regulator [Methylocapsa acidiphila]|uniref:helix-turn-helix transcriptional regulator n=1 Tax=Methylocapsa acidiphila TaxID=133552 RepID=UPI000561350D|nr:helix-turn-helix domain-containing protein [Methylocapsa acidiphila]